MKKIFTILSVFLGLGFLVCFGFGMFTQIPAEVSENSVFLYKFCTTVEYFAKFLPAMVVAGFIISLSVYFGHNSEGSSKRYSVAMAGRFKIVIISGLVCAFIVTLTNETFLLMAKRKKIALVNKPKLIAEYIDVGNRLLQNGYSDRALDYAQAALELNTASSEARDLQSKALLEINTINTNNLRFDLTSAQPLEEKDDSLNINPELMNDSYKCLLQAKSAFDNEQWFNAHYYAELGIQLSDAKNPNLDEMKSLSAEAWNNITRMHKETDTEGYQIYDRKYKGYLALVNKNDLEAYYIFRELYEDYPELQRDSDVIFYLDVATNRIEQEYFFVDETLELRTFESSNDVYFTYRHKNGAKEIVYFKGVASVQSTGQSIQYLRDLTILSLDRYGYWIRKLTVPYAKIMPVSVKNLTDATKEMLDIDEKTDFVPYILLRAVGRDAPGLEYIPTYNYPDGRVENAPEYLIFPMQYSEFLMLEDSSASAENKSLKYLFNLVQNASDYGFSEEEYGQQLLNRLLYPLFMLVLLVLTACFAWDNRIGETQMFRFSWVFSFPFMIAISAVGYKLVYLLFKLINYVILGMFGGLTALLVGAIAYILILIISSILFLSRYSA